LFLVKDASKPKEEACNPDGTLKNTDEMDWLNSLSDLALVPFENCQEHVLYVLDNEPDNKCIIKRCQVT